MKPGIKVLCTGVLSVALGVGVFVGNSLLASEVMAKDADKDKLIITKEAAAALPADEVKDERILLKRAILKQVQDGAIITQDTENVQEGLHDEGVPGGQDLPRDQSIRIAKARIIEKYALSPEILNKFSFVSTYHEEGSFVAVHEDAPAGIWQVVLQPLDNRDFPAIGSYSAVLDAATGQVIAIYSAADAVG